MATVDANQDTTMHEQSLLVQSPHDTSMAELLQQLHDDKSPVVQFRRRDLKAVQEGKRELVFCVLDATKEWGFTEVDHPHFVQMTAAHVVDRLASGNQRVVVQVRLKKKMKE